jgi:hypothetical protein
MTEAFAETAADRSENTDLERSVLNENGRV